MKIVFTICIMTAALSSYAQKNEQKALFTEFMQVCNAYKQTPLYLNMSYKVASNMATEQDDTTMVNGEFFINEGQAYIKFGTMEQVLTDTMVVVVMNDIKHIITHQNNQPVTEQLKTMMGKPLSNETMDELNDKYTITKIKQDKQNQILKIDSKKLVYEGMEPSVTIELTYNPSLTVPQKVVTVKRSLFKITETDGYDKIKKVEVVGKGTYGVKETSTAFFYNKIEHTKGQNIPVKIKDRVIKGTEDNMLPAKGYEDYMVTEN